MLQLCKICFHECTPCLHRVGDNVTYDTCVCVTAAAKQTIRAAKAALVRRAVANNSTRHTKTNFRSKQFRKDVLSALYDP